MSCVGYYQDVWVKGRVLFYGERECASRYVPIRGLLVRLGKPCKVLDFGADVGYFSVRTAYDFPESYVVAVDSNPDLPKIVKMNSLSNVEVINECLKAEELSNLGRFDVVIAYSILHHFDNWEKYMNALLSITDYALIENPQVDEHKHTYRRETANQIYNVLSKMENTTVVCYTPPRRFTAKIDFTGAKPRPIFLVARKPLPQPKPIKLKVEKGEGASSRTIDFWVTTDWKPIGFEPLWATLNLYGFESAVVSTWENKVFLEVKWGRRQEDNWRFWEWLIGWKIKIGGYAFCGFPRDGYFEVLAPFSIREALNIKYGDDVVVEPLSYEEETRLYVKRCYQRILCRQPDQEGLENYTRLILTGKIKRDELPKILSESPEAQKLKEMNLSDKQLAMRSLPQGGLQIDVGAAFADWTLAMLKKADEVWAFEPDARLLSQLWEIKSPKLRLFGFPLADKTGFVRLYVRGIGHTGITTEGNPLEFERIEIMYAETLDRLTCLTETPVTVIKIDVEGAEHLVLKGARETITKNKPIIIVEYHNNLKYVEEELKALNYTVIWKSERPHVKTFENGIIVATYEGDI
ncbi:MAG: FkbM family methyltransferase [Candidatus Bathyarchaeia archaeon]